MRALDLENAFVRYLGNHGHTLDNLNASTAIGSMAMFYAHHRVTDVDIDNDCDMLLFQWGTYGNDRQEFVYDITRQVITGSGVDDSIRQLSLSLYFPITATSRSLGNGSRWCPHPEQTETFLALIARHPAATHVSSARPYRTQVTFDHAG
ncbi:hypothetical protein [Nocardia sp.]|uniref:hypothetical protein n=1 Tax=Nocardia sp. TaxID=1821 RepID=UPI0026033D69|nr:hypothetical protein [Nocardia sp.]